MEVVFDQPTEITVVQEIKSTYSSIGILQMIDFPEMKRIVVQTRELGSLILWEGAAYDAIGQWTDQDVIDRIKELYQN